MNLRPPSVRPQLKSSDGERLPFLAEPIAEPDVIAAARRVIRERAPHDADHIERMLGVAS